MSLVDQQVQQGALTLTVRVLVEVRRGELEPVPISIEAGPKWVELMRRIDAVRDAEGVPRGHSGLLQDCLILFLELLTVHEIDCPDETFIEAVTDALVLPAMSTAAKASLQERIEGEFWALEKGVERAKAQRGRRPRKKRRH